MAVRLVRTALLAGILQASVVACGLVFAPGDYAESPPTTPVIEAGPSADVDVAPVDASPPDAGPIARILLVAGRRDSLPGEATTVSVAETMRTTLSSSGELGPWAFDVSPPVATSWSRAFVAGETLLLHSGTSTFTAKLTDRVTGEWTSLPPRGSAPESFLRPWIISDAGLTAAGGQAAGVFTGNVYVAPFNLGDGGVDPYAITASKLVKSRGDVTLLRHGSFLYALGGRDSTSSLAPGRDEVEVAAFGADGGLGMFAATTKLSNPGADAAAHSVFLPMVAEGAGWVFVIGGQTTASATSLSDVVLAAKIDEATGNLGAWVALPKLPTPLGAAAAVVAGNTLLVFGGNGGTAQTDAVLALTIQPSFEQAWRRIGSLPGPRSGLAAVVY